MQIPERVISELMAVTSEPREAILRSFEHEVATTIRQNTAKFSDPLNLPKVPWCSSGYQLPSRPGFTTDPLFHAGAYYVQESSSMFLEQAIRQTLPTDRPILALDLCGAPGGKSTHLLSLLSPDSVLISNEVIRSRSNILQENLTKWGYCNQAVINSDPRYIGESDLLFDLMVVDAPCSGEGLFRRNPEAIEQWSEDNVALCASRQQRILADVWPALKPGGILVYSTCTFNQLENEENLRWLRSQFDAVSVRISNLHNSIIETETDTMFGYRFVPTSALGEGFFIAVVRKAETLESTITERKNKNRLHQLKSTPAEAYLQAPANAAFIEWSGTHRLVSDQLHPLVGQLEKLRPVSIGTALGHLKGNDFIPAQDMANSIHLTGQQMVELSHDEALQFLSLGNVNQPLAKGWHVVAFRGVALGFVKSLGNRINNYFPKEWRIRTELSKFPKPYFRLDNFCS